MGSEAVHHCILYFQKTWVTNQDFMVAGILVKEIRGFSWHISLQWDLYVKDQSQSTGTMERLWKLLFWNLHKT